MAKKKIGSIVTIKSQKSGKRPIHFKKGTLHAQLHVPQGEKIPASKVRAALHGRYGAKAEKQARFAKEVLSKGRKTAAAHRRKK